MLVTVKRHMFDSLDDISLIWTCIEPTIKQIRGKNFMIKSEFSSQLNDSQRALLMFQVLYGHSANGVLGFFSHLSYLLSKKGVWSELKKGMEYFSEYLMADLIVEMEAAYHILEEKYLEKSSEWFDLSDIDKDSGLLITIDSLNKCLLGLLPAAVKSVALYIRKNPDEFVQFED